MLSNYVEHPDDQGSQKIKGTPGVSIGALLNVLRVLGLQDDFVNLAADDELGRKLQDLELLKHR